MFRVWVLALFFLMNGPLHAHEEGDWQPDELQLLFTSVQAGLLHADDPVSPHDVCVTADGETTCVPEDAFTHAFLVALPMLERRVREMVAEVTDEEVAEVQRKFTERWEYTRRKFGDGSLALSGWALEKVRIYGPSWLIYTLAFEAVEHFFLWWLPPGNPICALGQAVYFCTAGVVKSTYSVARHSFVPASLLDRIKRPLAVKRLEKIHRARLRSLLSAAHGEVRLDFYEASLGLPPSNLNLLEKTWKFVKDTPGYAGRRLLKWSNGLVWLLSGKEFYKAPDETRNTLQEIEEYLAQSSQWRAGHIHFNNGFPDRDGRRVKLEDDIEYVFGNAPVADRYWRAFQHVNGWWDVQRLLSRMADASVAVRREEIKKITDPAERHLHDLRVMRDYRDEKRFAGDFGALLDQVRLNLVAVALNQRDIDLGPAKDASLWLLAEMKRLVASVRFEGMGVAEPYLLLRRIQELRHVQKAFRRGNYLQFARPCARDIVVEMVESLNVESVSD